MRVIGGKCRGRRLFVPEDRSVRPVRDAVREALFSILGDWIEGKRVLDLYAGSGSLGIEALSRGASKAVFVESDSPTAETLDANLKTLELSGSAYIAREDVLTFLARAGTSDNRRGFHAVFADPPFSYSGSKDVNGLVSALGTRALWAEGELLAVLEVEEKGALLDELEKLPGEVEFRKYGRNLLCIARHGFP